MSTSTQDWRHSLVAYEDALASFYALQDGTRETLEQSGEIMRAMERLASVRRSIFEARRDLGLSRANDGVHEIERDRASIEVSGAALLVTNLVANVARAGSVLQFATVDP